ncbi:unnamed protein product [Ambrosiozyma monospora]|uniref:Unnamed protein product n=1 Tax=Ambrosiozyma monospora TaxID=43982 RepID=A0A9W6YPT8_AMBMO|nr:unnamed protein product [Ambrosiozyma monospora]
MNNNDNKKIPNSVESISNDAEFFPQPLINRTTGESTNSIIHHIHSPSITSATNVDESWVNDDDDIAMDNLNFDSDSEVRDSLLHHENTETNNNVKNQPSLTNNDTEAEMMATLREEYRFLPWYKRPSMLNISLVFLILGFSESFTMAAQLELVISGICSSVLSNPEQNLEGDLTCDSPIVQQSTVKLQQYLSVAPSVISLLISTKFGQLSDKHGRRPMLLIGIACSALSLFLNCIVLNPDIVSFNPYLVALGAMVGALGAPVMSITNTYLADVVDPENLTAAMGQMMAIMSISMGMGPLFSSLLHLESVKLLQIGVGMSVIGMIAAFL